MLSNSYPMLEFNLGAELDMMRDSLRSFVDDKILPRADEIDRTDTFPRDLWEPLGALGLHQRKPLDQTAQCACVVCVRVVHECGVYS